MTSLLPCFKRIFPSPSTVFKAPSFIARGAFALALLPLPFCFLPRSTQRISTKRGTVWKPFLGLAAALAIANSSFAQISAPGGRLTLQSGNPVMTSDVTGASTIYYVPYASNTVPYTSDDTHYTNSVFSPLTLPLYTGLPAGTVYDVFSYNPSPTTQILCAVAWSSSTARSVPIVLLSNGIWVNNATITTCYYNAGGGSYSFTAGGGIYLGSFYTTATGQTGVQFKPSGQVGGSNNIVGLWNAYNRVRIHSFETDTSGSYTYSGNAFQPTNYGANGGSNLHNRISWLDGLQQTSVTTRLKVAASTATIGAGIQIGVRLDAASTPYYVSAMYSPTANLTENLQTFYSEETFTPQMGFHYVQAMEASLSAVTATFFPGGVYTLILDGEY